MNKKGKNMITREKSHKEGFFQNLPDFFKHYKGQLITSSDIKLHDFTGLKVAVIGANQLTISYLDHILNSAEFVKVFQISPVFILPQTEKGVQKLISHPLIIKNRRLFNNRVKSMLAIRYLESQVKAQWLKRELMPNAATKNKVFFKSDTYYMALQRSHCKLITWPILKINENSIQSMQGLEHITDVIITTY